MYGTQLPPKKYSHLNKATFFYLTVVALFAHSGTECAGLVRVDRKSFWQQVLWIWCLPNTTCQDRMIDVKRRRKKHPAGTAIFTSSNICAAYTHLEEGNTAFSSCFLKRHSKLSMQFQLHSLGWSEASLLGDALILVTSRKPLTAVLPCPVRLATHRLIMSGPSLRHLLHHFN